MNDLRSEEQLIPLIRARLAERLVQEDFTIREIAAALNVTQPAVTQYLKKKRGKSFRYLNHLSSIVDPLSEKLARRIRSGLGGLEIAELLETGRQLMVINREGSSAASHLSSARGGDEDSVKLLKDRLQLELSAAGKYLDLANKTKDEQSKLLLRLIASDSIKHGDIVSQIISWLELGVLESGFRAPDRELLTEMMSLEDSAAEVNLRKNVKTDHPITRLLLEWIDTEEEKHEKIVKKILQFEKR
jgi:predicted transcriptional regulator/rubrerythrin